jgi:hypothetical protein
MNGKVMELKCPNPGCNYMCAPRDVRFVSPDDVYSKYVEFSRNAQLTRSTSASSDGPCLLVSNAFVAQIPTCDGAPLQGAIAPSRERIHSRCCCVVQHATLNFVSIVRKPSILAKPVSKPIGFRFLEERTFGLCFGRSSTRSPAQTARRQSRRAEAAIVRFLLFYCDFRTNMSNVASCTTKI